jgi:adenylate cyclase
MAKDYEIRFEPSPRRVRVEFNGTWIADSSRALILHETRLPPAYYFPREDVSTALLEKTERVTHCPFKGNASYWTVRAGGASAENAAWSYDEPYDDARPIRRYLSFYPDRVGAIYDGDEEIPQLAQAGAHESGIAAWLLTEAWKVSSPEALVDAFCRCLKANGAPIARMTVIIPTLHPQVFATVFVWREDAPVRIVYEPHDILHQPKFKDSPFAPILRGAGGVRRRMEQKDCKLDFPVVRDLHAEGATDYAAMPFRFADGQLNVMSMTSFTKGGFSAGNLGAIYEVLPMLGRLFEVFAQRRTATALLQTFLGHHTGARVLDGLVKHGDGEHINSVIWFSDLRESTKLSQTMAREEYLTYLNSYFNCLAGSILEKKGEVLRFIGDAALAIFPIGDPGRWSIATDAPEACRRALAAARLAGERIAMDNSTHPDRTPIRYGIGLHLGHVTYGNIGVPERLEFTVIGPGANTAARVESMCKTLGSPLVISAAFAAQCLEKLKSLGRHAVKDVEGEQELFTLP